MVVYQPSSQSYYSYRYLGTNTTVNNTIMNYVYDAAVDWRTGLGITLKAYDSISYSKNAYVVYAGSEEELAEIYGAFPSGNAGYTTMEYQKVASATYGSLTINISEFTDTCMVLVNTDESSGTWQTAVAHETGHALGWYGHHKSSSTLMYAQSTKTSPTTQDINHIKQIYDNYR